MRGWAGREFWEGWLGAPRGGKVVREGSFVRKVKAGRVGIGWAGL